MHKRKARFRKKDKDKWHRKRKTPKYNPTYPNNKNYPDEVSLYNTRRKKEVGLFNYSQAHHTRHVSPSSLHDYEVDDVKKVHDSVATGKNLNRSATQH